MCDVHVGGLISDHAPVFFRLSATVVAPRIQQVTCRAWRRLSTDDFVSDLAASELFGDLTSLDNLTADELVQRYNSFALTNKQSRTNSGSSTRTWG